MICLICGQEFARKTHLEKNHNITGEYYYINYMGNEKHKCVCGRDTKFISINKGYLNYCSHHCSTKSEESKIKRRNTNLERFGVDNPKKLKEFIDKGKETSLEKYQVSHPSKAEEVIKKNKETCLEKYGVFSTFQLKEVRDKFKENFIEKYGVENPFQLDKVKEKIKKTNIEKYGEENPSRSEKIKNKKVENSLKKFGVLSPNQSEIVKNKKRQTSLEKYGVDHPNKSIRLKEEKRKDFYFRLINSKRLNEKVRPLFSEDEFKSTSPKYNYRWVCLTCFNEFEDSLDCGRIPRCLKCNPHNISTSIFEKDVCDFCKQYYPNLIENDRSILDGQELDIYIPEINLAIECDGLYWHSELNGKDSNYHLNKTENCTKKA